MDTRPIHYEPHPVSPARKAELIAQGFRILDVKFAPPAAVKRKESALTFTGVVLTEGDAMADLHGDPRPDNPGRSSWAENETVTASAPTANELRAQLDAAGIEYPKHAPKAKLLELAAGL